MSPLRLAIVGCTGRMGVEILRLAANDAGFQVVAALTRDDDPRLGQDAGRAAGIDPLDVQITHICDLPCDVLVDFSQPAGLRHWAAWCAANRVPLVSGTTGLQNADQELLLSLAHTVPVVWAPNMSVGVHLLLRLVAEAAAALGESWDVEIAETHHRHKVDAPSGTARALLEAIRKAQNGGPDAPVAHGRVGQIGPRVSNEIGLHALRMGDVVGEHEVHFAAEGEVLTLRHRALSRKTFAAGALRAVRWVHGKPPRLYGLADVLAGRHT